MRKFLGFITKLHTFCKKKNKNKTEFNHLEGILEVHFLD